MINLYLFLQR